jgi:hypothetical protein
MVLRHSFVAQFAHADVSPIVRVIWLNIALSGVSGNGNPARRDAAARRGWNACLPRSFNPPIRTAVSPSHSATCPRRSPKAIRETMRSRAEDALESALAMYVAAKEPLPTSSEAEADEVMVPLSALGMAKTALYEARRRPCRARAPATLAPSASQSRARPAPPFTDGTLGSRARCTRPAADHRVCAGPIKLSLNNGLVR